MTICISAICENGTSLILAADTMLTNRALSIQFEHPTRKIINLAKNCVALTAGDALAHTELFNMVQNYISQLKSPSIFDIVDCVKKSYQEIRKREIKEKILMPRGFNDFKDFYENQRALLPDIATSIQYAIDKYDYGLEIIIAGITEGIAHIYGVSDPGTSECFDAVGFHAIGSGLPHALNSLIARQCCHFNPLKETILIVYEAKKNAEKAPGVGSKITDIYIMTPDKEYEFPRDRINDLDLIYKKWIERNETWMDDLDNLLKHIGNLP